jgi:hypothetical protein
MKLQSLIKPGQWTLALMLFAAIPVSIALPAGAQAATKRYTNEADYCKGKQENGDPNPCAALVYVDATTNYYVNKVSVQARAEDNQNWDKNSNCLGYSTDNTMDIRADEYGVFILPAPCSYKLTIHIGGGDSKSQHVFLSPGCELVLESKGTTLNDNTPKVKKVEWTDEAKKLYASKTPPITVSKSDVSDGMFHHAMGGSAKHYCNKDDNANKNFN